MTQKLHALKARKGFTLVELIVVIAIIGVLAAILVPTLLTAVTKARVASANNTAADIQKLINVFLLGEDLEGNRIGSGPAILKIAVNGNTWTSTAAPAGVIPGWKNGVKWGSGGTYTIGDDIESIKSGEALLCAAICSEFGDMTKGSIVIAFKNNKCTFAAYTINVSEALDDEEYPVPVNGEPPSSFEWKGEEGVSKSGYFIGTAPQIKKA